MKIFSWKLYLSVIVLITAIIYFLPTFKPGIWPHKKINLGLDLQGGMHLALEVESEKAVESSIERMANDLKGLFRSQHLSYQKIERIEGTKISIVLEGQENIDGFDKILEKEFKELRIVSRSNDGGLLKIVMDYPEKEAETIKKLAIEQALETIRNRIDQFGVSEPDISLEGKDRIIVQLPGVSDTQRAKELIGKTALLEFKLLDETQDPEKALSEGAPPGTEILYETKEDPRTRRVMKQPYLVKKLTLLTGASLSGASVQIDSQYNEPYVSIDFDNKGAKSFERITEENVKKRLAIVLDNKVYSAPVIQEKISGGHARITGSFTAEEARDLAIVLRAGALPAPVKIIEERTVGPSLGTDSINKGLLSMWIGGLLIFVFMAFYYKWSGVVADIGLVFNVLLITGALAAFQATLTLPGLAGIVLTIGMAVDANVLIYERIREELALGKTARAAVDAGFERATWTILDSNVTTLIAGLVLFQFGTGPVKGFAVTLSIGIVTTVFTALIMTRVIFEYFIYDRKIKKLSI
ncbi:preprotein translocase subunit SecD [Desulfobacterium sp. N47]|uniref:Protein translocase subunit SecD n=1 Tax=uncultured Desulfobacterium sp. TaxID=201089 RepID=E1YHR5_9BACT|nr:Protein-export membrane protein secD [uncultured Desulfobacterium sp.]